MIPAANSRNQRIKPATNWNPRSGLDPGPSVHEPPVGLLADTQPSHHQPAGPARPRMRRIVRIASHFRSNVSLVVKGRRASARNIVAVMLLTASVGTTVRLEIDGPDEVEAMREITALFHDGFGERS